MWLITCGHPAIRQRFFAAIDGLERLCWVNEATRAKSFQLREDAETFAALHCAEHDWALTRA